jgi:methionine-rich copper-binding protein CopC
MKRIYNKALAALLCTLFAFALPSDMYAHAVLVESSPKDGSRMKGPNLPLSLRFNVRVDGSRSRFSLVFADSTAVPVALEPQTKPNVLSAKANGLKAGKYKLQWQVLAADGHITRGEFTFYVE